MSSVSDQPVHVGVWGPLQLWIDASLPPDTMDLRPGRLTAPNWGVLCQLITMRRDASELFMLKRISLLGPLARVKPHLVLRSTARTVRASTALSSFSLLDSVNFYTEYLTDSQKVSF